MNFCTQCGTPTIKADQVACTNCGTMLRPNGPTAPQAATAPAPTVTPPGPGFPQPLPPSGPPTSMTRRVRLTILSLIAVAVVTVGLVVGIKFLFPPGGASSADAAVEALVTAAVEQDPVAALRVSTLR